MTAGHRVGGLPVRPFIGFAEDIDIDEVSDADSEGESDKDKEEMEADPDLDGEECIRLCAEKDDGSIKRITDPMLPSEAEVEEHILAGHMPYRNWCPVCIKAKGKDSDHRADCGKDRKLSEYSFDYCFPGDELGFKWTVLVGKERGFVPMKIQCS